MRPRAFFRKSIEKPVGMARASPGSDETTASPVVSSPKLASATACSDRRWLRRRGRSRMTTRTRPGARSITSGEIDPV